MFSDQYYITIFNGLNEIARDEIQTKLPQATLETIYKARDNSLLMIKYQDNPKDLGQLGMAEDVFYMLDVIALTRGKDDLSLIKANILTNNHLERGLRVHRLFRQKIHKGKTTFRVVAQASDKYGYRRVDAQHAVEKAITQRYNRKWRLVDETADIEFWLHLIGNRAVIGIRLSTATMRLRDYKKAHIPASLRPTIAFAMVWIAGIDANDVFCDPMCGAGTILIERARAGRYTQLLGGDHDAHAVQATLDNIGSKYQPIHIQQWDATQIPLQSNSVHKLCTNLPFGRQINTHQSINTLYRDFLREAERILLPGGTMVLLTTQKKALEDNLAMTSLLRCATIYRNIDVLGQNVSIYHIRKL